jgi:transcriptional regulator with XRE-family HTH domain
MTYTEISAKLAELGQPIPTLGLTRIEKGERRVDIDEVVALAQVFGVPPIALMFPIGHAEETELLPGQRLDPWHAAKWFMGKETLSGEPKSREAAIVGLFDKHDTLMDEAGYAYSNLQLWPGPADDPKRNDAEREWRIKLRDLRYVRAQIRNFKLTPPALDDGLEMVDDTTYRFLTQTELASHFPNTNYPPGLVVEQLDNGNVWPVDFAEKDERNKREERRRGEGK